MKVMLGIKMSCEEKQIIEKMINLTKEMYNSSQGRDFSYLLFGDEGNVIYDFDDVSEVLKKILDCAI